MFRRNRLALGCLSSMILAVAGCIEQRPVVQGPNYIEMAREAASRPNLVAASYEATDRLIDNLRVDVKKTKPVLVASLVNVDDLERSSTFGRIVSEQIGSRLTQHGYFVSELKLRSSFLIKNKGGEFILSRDLMEIGRKHHAQAVVAGTYAAGTGVIYVSIRMISVADARVVSAYDYSLSRGRTLNGLIAPKMPAAGPMATRRLRPQFN